MRILIMAIALSFALVTTIFAKEVPVIDSVPSSDRVVAISVENISTVNELEKVVALSETQDIKLTFFLSGQFIEKNPLAVQKAVAKGHEFGNYGLGTKYWGAVSQTEIAKELADAGAILYKTTGVASKIVRPPYNYYETTFLNSSDASFLTVIRGLDTGDWTINSPQAVVDKVKSNMKNGDIISINMKAKYSAAALPEVVSELKNRGYKILTVSELLARASVQSDKARVIKSFAIVRHVTEASPKVALTFDDGGSGYSVNSILEALRNNGIHATFFVSGEWADNNSSLIQKIAEDGHEIANHSYSHPMLSWLSAEDIEKELLSTEAAIKKAIGYAPQRYFRPPYGDYNAAVADIIRQLGYEAIILWDVDTRDWSGIAPQTIVDRVVDQVSGGSIVLFHLHARGTPDALFSLIPELKARGYILTTVGDLLN